MYQNVIFDLGGVVVNSDPRNWLVDRFFNEKIEDDLHRLTFGSEIWQRWARGEIGINTVRLLVEEQAKAAGRLFEAREVLENWQSMLTNKNSTIDMIRRMKKSGVHVYYLSNTEKETLEILQQRDFWKYWDGGVASCDIGICKPDPRIYQSLLMHYQLDPASCLYVDDKKENIDQAAALGIAGILYQNPRALASTLMACGVPIRTKNRPGLHKNKKTAAKAPTEKK